MLCGLVCDHSGGGGGPLTVRQAFWFGPARPLPLLHTCSQASHTIQRAAGAMSGAGEADDYLEDYYDAIVLSTGLGSSILAA